MPKPGDASAPADGARPARRTRKPARRAPKEVTADEVIARYPGQWILMRVTAWGERRTTERGYLLAHSPSLEIVEAARLDAIRAGEPAPGTLDVFEAYPPIRTHEEWRAGLQRLAEEWEGDPFDLRPTRSVGLVELDDDGRPHLIEPPWPVCRISKRNKPARG
jgi:hypothetical protein